MRHAAHAAGATLHAHQHQRHSRAPRASLRSLFRAHRLRLGVRSVGVVACQDVAQPLDGQLGAALEREAVQGPRRVFDAQRHLHPLLLLRCSLLLRSRGLLSRDLRHGC